ncbi:hypothetical protein [Desulfobacter vibrioformis]|uniref:hypothetical protein n=1 Tax=Desulfobacter vibrioformis TaxID=34031 RepID=UPI0006893916|nr:hypothetical protein [Desulfobacter vibrioformis]
MEIEINTKPGLICLEKERLKRFGCKHMHILVHEDLAYCKCKDCGELLNPMAVLCRFARKESRYVYERIALNNQRKKLEAKKRTKCEHCGEMTRVNIIMTGQEWRGFEST